MEVDSSFDFPLNYFDFIAENLFPSLKENEAERTSNGYGLDPLMQWVAYLLDVVLLLPNAHKLKWK